MDWMGEVTQKIARKNQILFSTQSVLLQDLSLLAQEQTRRTLVLWAFDLAEEAVDCLEEKYPAEQRPRSALEASKLWAQGKIKMPVAKKEILCCHAMAKEVNSPEDKALCHAIGQACSVVHTRGHAMGFPIYELTALVHRYGPEKWKEAIESRNRQYLEKLCFWRDNSQKQWEWAAFLQKEK